MPLLLALFLLVSAPDSLGVLERSAQRERSLAPRPEKTASSALLSPFAAYSSVEAGVDGTSQKAPLFPEEGDHRLEGTLRISLLSRKDSTSAVGGKVLYSNGIKRNVLWNSTSDYFLVYPYAVADSVGGDCRREQYFFSGSYAFRKGAWHYGFAGSYRALHEWREADPRPRNIVSDLTLGLSTGFRLSSGAVLDAGVKYRRYSQSSQISFYNTRGANSSVFHLTGLGSHYARFAGSNSMATTTRYGGSGIGASLSFLGAKGWFGFFSYEMTDIVHYLPSQNETPYQEVVVREARLSGGYATQKWKVQAHVNGGFRSGLEYVLDNGNRGLVQTLMRFAMFSRLSFDAGAQGTYIAGPFLFTGGLAAEGFHAQHNYPGRVLSSAGLDSSLGASWLQGFGSWLLGVSARAEGYVPFGAQLIIPEQFTMPALTEYYTLRKERLERFRLGAGLSVKAQRRLLRSLSVYAGADCLVTNIQDNTYKLFIGLNF